jgi:hypothetical protein
MNPVSLLMSTTRRSLDACLRGSGPWMGALRSASPGGERGGDRSGSRFATSDDRVSECTRRPGAVDDVCRPVCHRRTPLGSLRSPPDSAATTLTARK